MKAMKDFKNSLLHRREVVVSMQSESNPGFANALKMISEQFKTPEDQIALKAVRSKFGAHDFLIEAFIYDSPEHRNRIEPKIKVKKKAEGA
jgi:ribosomal protein S24E